MKKYKINLPPLAQSDITEIDTYITENLFAPDAAINLLDRFIKSFEQLEIFPLSGKELETKFPLKYNYRWILVENYLVFYIVDEENETVTIMRILYASSNYQKILQ